MIKPLAFKEELRSQLVAGSAAYVRRRRRQRGGVLVLASVLAVTGIVTGVTLADDGSDQSREQARTNLQYPRLVSSQTLRISQVDDGIFVVSVNEAAADPAAMMAELASAGIDANITLDPVSPSLVGRLTAFQGLHEPPQPNEMSESVELHRNQSYELSIGRAAAPDETYLTAYHPFSSGEPLYCSGLDPLTNPLEVEAALQARGLDVSWRYLDLPGRGSGPGVFSGSTEEVATAPAGVVSGYASLTPHTVVVFVSPDEQVPEDRSELFPPQDC